MRILALCLCCVAATLFPGQQPTERTYLVPRLHGEPVAIKESDTVRITPLGWAMLLEHDPSAQDAFDRRCQEDPELREKVLSLYRSKAIIENASRRPAVRTRILFGRR